MTAPESSSSGYEPPNGNFNIGVVDHRGCGDSAVFPRDQAAVVFADLDNTEARARVPMDIAKAHYEQKKRLLSAAIEECAADGGDALAQEEAAPPADDGARLELAEEFTSGRAGALRHELEEGRYSLDPEGFGQSAEGRCNEQGSNETHSQHNANYRAAITGVISIV